MFNLIQLVLKLLVLLLHLLDIIVRLRSPILSTHLPLPIALFLLFAEVLSHLDFILGKTLEHVVFTAGTTALCRRLLFIKLALGVHTVRIRL